MLLVDLYDTEHNLWGQPRACPQDHYSQANSNNVIKYWRWFGYNIVLLCNFVTWVTLILYR